jgi:hypothetical protein
MNCPKCGAVNYGTAFCMSCRFRMRDAAGAAAPTPSAPVAPRAPASGRNPAQTAALASVGAPLAVAFLNAMLRQGESAMPDAKMAIALVQVGLTSFLLLVGVVAGIVALVQMGRYGTDGVRGRAIIGLAMCTGLFGIMAVGFASGFQRRLERQRIGAQIDEKTQSTDRLLERAAAGEDIIGQGSGHMSEVSALLRKAADTQDEPQRSMSLATADVTDMAAVALRDKEAALRPFIDAGGIGANGLDTREALYKRQAFAKLAQEATARYEAVMMALPAELQKRLAQRQVPPDRLAPYVRSYTDGLKLDTVSEMCRTDREFMAAAVGIFAELEASFGRWQVDAASNSIVFMDDGPLNRYNALLQQAQTAAGQQTEIQQKHLASRRKKK